MEGESKQENRAAGRQEKKTRREGRKEGVQGVWMERMKGQLSNSVGQCWYVMCEWWREELLFCVKG